MRLKLFWMPYNAIMASLLVSEEAFALSDWLQSFVRCLVSILSQYFQWFSCHRVMELNHSLIRIPQNRRKWVTWAALIILFSLMSSWALPKLKILYEDEKEWHHEDLQSTSVLNYNSSRIHSRHYVDIQERCWPVHFPTSAETPRLLFSCRSYPSVILILIIEVNSLLFFTLPFGMYLTPL